MSGSFVLFLTALDYIEHRLTDDIPQEDIARACCCSLSSLQKTWRFVTDTSIKDYISKRRITLAGRDMLENGLSVLDAAMKYGYNSHEVFTRAFTKVWGMTPSAFKKSWKGSCLLYPPLSREYAEGDVTMNINKFDIREFYDYLKTQAGTCVLCFDIMNLMQINDEYGTEAGDRCIIEAFRRINAAAGEDMICLRIGGDEFVMLTGSKDTADAAALADRVLSLNGEEVSYSGGTVPLTLSCGVLKIGTEPELSVLCENFTDVIKKSRSAGRVEFL